MTPPFKAQSENWSWRSAALSFGVHLALLIALALMLRPSDLPGKGEGDRPGKIVLASIDQLNERVTYEEPAAEPSVQPPALETPQPENPFPVEMALQPPPASASAEPALNTVGDLDAALMADARQFRGRATEVPLNAEQLAAIAAEQRELARRAPPVAPATTSVFGSGAVTGRKFVFVLDRSKSMGSQGLGVLNKARTELAQSLSALGPEHQFQIIAYHHQSVMMNSRKMLSATRENIGLVADFIDNLAPFGGTNHEGALFSALALQPDVVIVLTDGDEPGLHDGQLAALKVANRGRATIHVVQFGTTSEPTAPNFLRKMAEQSGGRYTYFNVNQWTNETSEK